MTTQSFTSESVTEGHPDKVADRISDSILDAYLAQDPQSRVACETLVAGNRVVIAGEISSDAEVDATAVARQAIHDIGYDSPDLGFDAKTCEVEVHLGIQSSDIAMGVSEAAEARGDHASQDLYDLQGAGDQGMMFGYATTETDVLMPLPIHLAHRMAERLAAVRKSEALPYLRPDGKTQVTFEYDSSGKPVRLHTVLTSTQHDPDIDRDEELTPALLEHVIRPSLPAEFVDDDFRVIVNPTGRFVIGGPVGDAGLTGRKIIVDTYGGMARHGGGAFSGKDASKVDRSGAYATRWVAKNVVASGAASRCEVQIAYAIGVARPVSILVETFGTETVDPAKLAMAIEQVFDLRPGAIIADLDLKRPVFAPTSAYGHFGRAGDGFTWERLDRVDDLRSALNL
ncbi:MAG: methionine adenosyltransferase [Acidimicrobiia bacterium]|nr:methionine adenosyltransferase [Acidimicrobiia bacterium]